MPEGLMGESDADAIKSDRSASGAFFPRWVNYLLPLLVLGVMGAGLYVPVLIFTGLSAKTLNVGYNPDQPIPYSHALHVGELGLDCRHCHYTVDKAAFAAIPPTETCVACHNPSEGTAGVGKDLPSLIPLRESYENGTPIPWIKVHDLADYAYFNHSAHVLNGVGCVTCHGRVDRMGEEGVHQEQPLSMAWCLDCHRQPEQYLRPNSEITNMGWSPLEHPLAIEAIANGELKDDDEAGAQRLVGEHLLAEYNVHPAAYMQQCSTCHR